MYGEANSSARHLCNVPESTLKQRQLWFNSSIDVTAAQSLTQIDGPLEFKSSGTLDALGKLCGAHRS